MMKQSLHDLKKHRNISAGRQEQIQQPRKDLLSIQLLCREVSGNRQQLRHLPDQHRHLPSSLNQDYPDLKDALSKVLSSNLNKIERKNKRSENRKNDDDQFSGLVDEAEQ